MADSIFEESISRVKEVMHFGVAMKLDDDALIDHVSASFRVGAGCSDSLLEAAYMSIRDQCNHGLFFSTFDVAMNEVLIPLCLLFESFASNERVVDEPQ